MTLQVLPMSLNVRYIITCLLLLHQFATAALPHGSTDFLLSKSGPGRLRDTDLNSLSSSVNFHPSLITCTYHGIWGCPIWRVRVTFPPTLNPDLGLDSAIGSSVDLPSRPMGFDINDTSGYPLRHASTSSEPSSLETPTSRLQSLLRETCGSTTDGNPNVSDFQTENRADESSRVEFHLAYARVLEDIIQPARSCVEDALERMFAGEEGMRIQCRMPGVWQDHGPPQHDWPK